MGTIVTFEKNLHTRKFNGEINVCQTIIEQFMVRHH